MRNTSIISNTCNNNQSAGVSILGESTPVELYNVLIAENQVLQENSNAACGVALSSGVVNMVNVTVANNDGG